MTVFQNIGGASDRVMCALISGLEIEFGRGVSEALAARFLDAEDVDFTWDARILERWIGGFDDQDHDEIELDRVAICGKLDRYWYCAICIVDGDGGAHGMNGKRIFSNEIAAREAWEAIVADPH